jgi:hypothetical protein
MLSHSYRSQQAVLRLALLSKEYRSKLRVVQIHIDSLRRTDSVHFEFRLLIQIQSNNRAARIGRVPYIGHNSNAVRFVNGVCLESERGFVLYWLWRSRHASLREMPGDSMNRAWFLQRFWKNFICPNKDKSSDREQGDRRSHGDPIHTKDDDISLDPLPEFVVSRYSPGTLDSCAFDLNDRGFGSGRERRVRSIRRGFGQRQIVSKALWLRCGQSGFSAQTLYGMGQSPQTAMMPGGGLSGKARYASPARDADVCCCAKFELFELLAWVRSFAGKEFGLPTRSGKQTKCTRRALPMQLFAYCLLKIVLRRGIPLTVLQVSESLPYRCGCVQRLCLNHPRQ